MPHDAFGKLLMVGDDVILTGRVTFIGSGEDYCNIKVQLHRRMQPGDTVTTIEALNAKQVAKVKPSPAEAGQELLDCCKGAIAGLGGVPGLDAMKAAITKAQS